ncbi:MAG: glycerol-3-phosphate 1-O-acyltransferase PlsY [Candidatus Pelagibacter sp.]
MLFLILFLSYFIGSIPFGFLLTKIFLKKDIREIGSGNIGATNALRTGNKLIGYSTLTLDISKAVILLLIIKFNFSEYLFISSIAVFLGHVFPIWLNFKGGKGVATYVGILFCVNIYLVIVFIVSWIVIFTLTRYSSLASMLSSLFVPLTSYFLLGDKNYYFYIIFSLLILITHRENIKRLKNNTESKTKIY